MIYPLSKIHNKNKDSFKKAKTTMSSSAVERKIKIMPLRETSQWSRLKKDASETPKKIKRANQRHRTNLLSRALNLANLMGILNII